MTTAARPAPATASILVNAVDGTRNPLRAGKDLLVRILDGNQNQVHTGFHEKSSLLFRELPFSDNLADNYTVIASAKGYRQAGFTPVRISPRVLQTVNLMLLPRDGAFNFNLARWTRLKTKHPSLIALLSSGAASAAAARDRYDQLMEQRPGVLASLLNVVTAMEAITLPLGNPMDYLKQLIWDESLAQDRFFAWADRQLVDQVQLAADQGVFAPEIGSGFFHPGATSSYKQVQFGEANLQLTFHEHDQATIDGAECIKVEPDIDYFRDALAHALLEVLPNNLTGGQTDPRTVYVLRWIAGRHAGVPEFDPPYTIEAVA
jgi:hypothetical protein